MAFNPLSSFRKYPKVWMSGVLLICMLTFVFERFFTGNLPAFLMPKRDHYVKVGGKNYYYTDFEELRDNRNVANDFMRTLAEMGIRQLDKQIKSYSPQDLKDDKTKRDIGLMTECQRDLFNKLSHDPRYFHGGTKTSDLIDFVVWLQLADKYNVYLTDDDISKIVNREVHAGAWNFNEYVSREVQNIVHRNNYKATDAAIVRALRDEFRVRIIQLGLMAKISGGPMIPTPDGFSPERDFFARMGLYLHMPMQARTVLSPDQLFGYYRKTRTELDFDLLPVSLEKLADKVKLPDDPDERLKVLKEFYGKYATNPYNPGEDKPGFLFPAQAQIQYLTADAGMEYYKKPAQAVSLLQQAPPIAFNPLMPLAGALSELSAKPAWGASLERNYAALQENYQKQWDRYIFSLKSLQAQGKIKEINDLLQAGPPAFKYTVSSWLTRYYWNTTQYHKALEKPKPSSAAALVGNSLGAPGLTLGAVPAAAAYQADAYVQQLAVLKPMMKADRKRRIQFGVELILAGLQSLLPGAELFTAASLIYYADTKPHYLPLTGFVEEDLRTGIEERMAQEWMNTAMLEIKVELDAAKGRKAEVFQDKLRAVLDKYSRQEVGPADVAAAGIVAAEMAPRTVSGVKLGGTTQLRNEYDIDLDDGLKPLRDSFDKTRFLINSTEGRSGKPDMLKEGDFQKLFFGNDPIGVGPVEGYVPNVWPPYITPKKSVETLVTGAKPPPLRLFDTDPQPIIYWKTVKKGKEVLTWQPSNAEFMKLVEKQYRMDKARGLILDEVKRLTAELKKDQQIQGKDIRTKMRDLAKESGLEVIPVNKVAMLVETPNRGSSQEEVATYEPYSLPRGRIPFAREDMVKQLLSMNNQSAPVKLGLKEVDDLNEALFLPNLSDKAKQVVKQIQVLANKPKTDYYIVTLARVQEPSSFVFFDDILPKAFSLGKEQNRFIDQAQEEFGKEFLVELTRQLRLELNVDIADSAKKQIEVDATSGQQ